MSRSLFSVAILAVGLFAWNAPAALAQKGGHGGGHSSGGAHSSHGSSYHSGHYGSSHYSNSGHNHNGHHHHGAFIVISGYPGYWGYPYYGSNGYGANSYADDYPAADYSYDSYYYAPVTDGAPSQPNGPVVNVDITDQGFNPVRMEIKLGTTVRFTNNGSGPRALAQPQFDWQSKTMNSGQTYSWTFKEPGTYDLRDSTRPGSTMQIIVH
jgi:plastocyanin